MPQLDPINLFASQIFWMFVSFALIYFIVAKLFGPKVVGVITQRSTIISDNIELAEKLKNEASDIEQQYNQALTVAKQQALDARISALDSATKNTNAELAKIEAEVEQKISAAEAEVNTSKKSIIAELESSLVTELVQKVTSNISGVDVPSQKIEQLVQSISKKS